MNPNFGNAEEETVILEPKHTKPPLNAGFQPMKESDGGTQADSETINSGSNNRKNKAQRKFERELR